MPREPVIRRTRTREVIEGLTMFGTGGVKPEQLPIHISPGVQDDYILLPGGLGIWNYSGLSFGWLIGSILVLPVPDDI